MKFEKSVVIGGGAVGSKFHIPRILHFGQSTSVFIVDTNESQRENLTRMFHKDSRVTICSGIPAGNFDLAVVATPPKYHFKCFEQLSSVCKHIIVEKPLAKTAQEARDMVAMADELGIKIYVGLIRRSLSNFPIVRSWIETELFGKLQTLEVAEGAIFRWDAVSQGSFSKDLNGGGVLMDTGPHTLDQLYQIFDKIELKSARLDALPLAGSAAIEANASLDLVCDGIPATVLLSRNRALSNKARFYFERATVEIGLHEDSMVVNDGAGYQLHGLPGGIDKAMSYPELFDEYYRRFILQGSNLGISASDSLRLQDLIMQIYDNCELMEGYF